MTATEHPTGAAPETAALPSHRFSVAWREHLDVRLDVLDFAVNAAPDDSQRELARHHLERARGAVRCRPGVRSGWSGVDVERAWAATHAAEVALFRAAEAKVATAMLTDVVDDCTRLLPGDRRLPELTAMLDARKVLTQAQQAQVAEVLESAYRTSDAQHMQVRSFRNVLMVTAAALLVLAVAIGLVAALAPQALALCGSTGAKTASTCPTGAHHPTGGDVYLVELLGLAAAAITAAFAIRNLKGTSTPYAVPLATVLLKLPIGALTAFGGLLLVRAGFGPTATAGYTQAVAAGYALVFGAAQQLFMQFVDKRANAVLDSVTTPGDKSAKKPPASR